MAYNVPAVYDVFASPIKERGAFLGLQKCAEEKTHKGRKPDCVFSSAKPATAGAAYTVLLYDVWPYPIIFNIIFLHNIFKNILQCG
jgi:hypothetical protein